MENSSLTLNPLNIPPGNLPRPPRSTAETQRGATCQWIVQTDGCGNRQSGYSHSDENLVKFWSSIGQVGLVWV